MYSLPILGTGKPYSHFSFHGRLNQVDGVYYTYRFFNTIFFGEGSYSNSGGFATLNGIIFSADSKFNYGILYRNYSVRYQNLKSNSFGINSSNSNEHGLYLTFNYTINRMLSAAINADVYKFPFLKYKVDAPSSGTNLSVQFDYKPNKKFSAQFRFRKRLKEENGSQPDNISLAKYYYYSIRFSSTIKIDNDWSYGMRCETQRMKTGSVTNGQGSIISQDIFYKPMGKRWSFNVRYSIFNCSEFENRIYEYENDVQGAFSVPFYYGNGTRFYINANLKIGRSLTLSARYAKTWQDDRVNYNEKSDVKLQLKAVF
jgi:hypothetical protein